MHAMTRTRPAAYLLATMLAGAGLICGCSHDKKAEEEKAQQGSTTTLKAGGFHLVHDDWGKIGYRLDWVGFPFLGEEDEENPVTIVKAYDDLLIVQNRQSTVSALETGNGQRRWSVQLAGPLTKFVGINRDAYDTIPVIVSSESDMFAISAANGSIMSRERYARVVNTQPVLAANLLIAGTSTGEVEAHHLGRNVKAWGFMSSGAFERNPVVVGDVVAAVSQVGDVLFLTAGGSLVGRGRVYEGLDTDPVADNGLLFIAGRDRSVWAFDPSGYNIWRHRTSSRLSTQPTAHNGVLYVDIPGNGLTAFEEATGRVMWKAPNVNGTVIASRNGKLLVRNGGTITMIDPGRGDILERINTPGIAKIVFDKFDDGRMYLVNDSWNVAKMIPR
jgi:outer membrane protein assembly factor BamB